MSQAAAALDSATKQNVFCVRADCPAVAKLHFGMSNLLAQGTWAAFIVCKKKWKICLRQTRRKRVEKRFVVNHLP